MKKIYLMAVLLTATAFHVASASAATACGPYAMTGAYDDNGNKDPNLVGVQIWRDRNDGSSSISTAVDLATADALSKAGDAHDCLCIDYKMIKETAYADRWGNQHDTRQVAVATSAPRTCR